MFIESVCGVQYNMWPVICDLPQGILSSLLEVGCVTWFTSHVASQLPVFVVIPALASVMALSSVSPWLSKARVRSLLPFVDTCKLCTFTSSKEKH